MCLVMSCYGRKEEKVLGVLGVCVSGGGGGVVVFQPPVLSVPPERFFSHQHLEELTSCCCCLQVACGYICNAQGLLALA